MHCKGFTELSEGMRKVDSFDKLVIKLKGTTNLELVPIDFPGNHNVDRWSANVSRGGCLLIVIFR